MLETERNYVGSLRSVVNVQDHSFVILFFFVFLRTHKNKNFRPQFMKFFDESPKTSDKERDLLSTIFANAPTLLALNEPFLAGMSLLLAR